MRLNTAVFLAAAAAALLWPPVAPAGLGFHACEQPEGIVCATVVVPLDRTGKLPGVVHLHVEKKPAAEQPAKGALFVFTGGPGFGVSGEAAMWIRELAPALRTRDLILMDYRGVGRSDRLSCHVPASLPAPTYAERCSAAIGPKFQHYSSWDLVEDAESVRSALGVQRIAVVGSSYGTLIGERYARRYPSHVEFVVLDSVGNDDGPDPWDRTMVRALPRVLRAVCAGGACKGITPDPVGDLRSFLERLGPRVLTLSYVDQHGKLRHVEVGSAGFFNLFESDPLIFQAVSRGRLPSALEAALFNADDYPLGRAYEEYSVWFRGGLTTTHSGSDFDLPGQAATYCEDMAVPWRGIVDPAAHWQKAVAAAAALPRSAVAPFAPVDALHNLGLVSCLGWNVAPTRPTDGPLAVYRGPTLMIEGEDDLRTPLENAQALRKYFPRTTLLVVPAYGHVALGNVRCADAAFAAFVAGTPVAPCPRGPLVIPPELNPPTKITQLAPWPSLTGAAGETLSAVVDTVRDVLYTSYTEGPFVGLRAGTITIAHHETATLHGIVYVPDVTVSGTFDVLKGVAHVAVKTPTGTGSISITPAAITGELLGTHVAAPGVTLLFGHSG